MTDIEKFNILWLCHAMTVPVNCTERYYYDGEHKKFFYTRTLSEGVEVLNDIDLYLTENECKALFKRLNTTDTEANNIVEIPRFNVEDKKSIQLLFLSKFPNVWFEDELRLAVEEQLDDYKFVLDEVLIENDNSAPMAPYWDDFKLQTVYNYVEQFATSIGLELRPS